MKRKPFEDYSKPPCIGDIERMEIIYSAVEKLIYDPSIHTRMGDIAGYLERTRDEEWNSAMIARLIYNMKKKLGWMYKEIDGSFYPVCCPLNNECTTLAVRQ